MKNTFLDASKSKGFFITILPRFIGTAKDAIILRARKRGSRFELLRERYQLVPRQKKHVTRTRHRRRGIQFSHRPLMVRHIA